MSTNDPNDPADQTQSPAGEPTFNDDGFSPEERAAFESMRSDQPIADDVAAKLNAPEPTVDTPAAPPAAAAPPPPSVAGDDDDDDGSDDVPGVEAPDGEKPKHTRRVALSKHQRIVGKLTETQKQLQDRLTEEATRRARIEERLSLINEALTTPQQQQPQVEEDPEPSEDDIWGRVEWQKRQIAKLGNMLLSMHQQGQQTQQQRDEQQRARDEQAQMESYYYSDTADYGKKEPQFINAYNHLMMSRDEELKVFGYTDPNQRAQLIRGEEQALIRQAMQESQQTGKRVSVADRIMQLAKGRGFVPGAAPVPAAGSGSPPAPAAAPAGGVASSAPGGGAPAPKPSVSAEVQRLRDNQQRNMSLSDGGGAPPPQLTTENLATMDDDAFGQLLDKLPKAELQRLMGR